MLVFDAYIINHCKPNLCLWRSLISRSTWMHPHPPLLLCMYTCMRVCIQVSNVCAICSSWSLLGEALMTLALLRGEGAWAGKWCVDFVLRPAISRPLVPNLFLIAIWLRFGSDFPAIWTPPYLLNSRPRIHARTHTWTLYIRYMNTCMHVCIHTRASTHTHAPFPPLVSLPSDA